MPADDEEAAKHSEHRAFAVESVLEVEKVRGCLQQLLSEGKNPNR